MENELEINTKEKHPITDPDKGNTEVKFKTVMTDGQFNKFADFLAWLKKDRERIEKIK